MGIRWAYICHRLLNSMITVGKYTCSSYTIPSNTETSKDIDKQKITVLEMKTKNLEHQIAVIFSKIENQPDSDRNLSTQQKVILYACYICDCDFTSKEDLKKHMNLKHATKELLCSQKAPIVSNNKVHELHFKCQSCEYNADTEKDLEEHTVRFHWKCKQCSYRAIHNKDMRRHINTMHPQEFQCNFCQFKAVNHEELKQHIQYCHQQTTMLSCDVRMSTTQAKRESEKHSQQNHKQRTRIFSSNRVPLTPTVRDDKQSQPQRGMFRPWSLPTSLPSSSSSSLPTSARSKPSTAMLDGYLEPNSA